MYETSSQLRVRALAVAVVGAVVVAVVWGFLPNWGFWFAIGAGFLITEGIVRATGAKRGSTYQTIGMLGVAACIVLARVMMAYHANLDPAVIGQVFSSTRLDSPRAVGVTNRLALDLPNIVYSGLALAIPYVRFR